MNFPSFEIMIDILLSSYTKLAGTPVTTYYYRFMYYFYDNHARNNGLLVSTSAWVKMKGKEDKEKTFQNTRPFFSCSRLRVVVPKYTI